MLPVDTLPSGIVTVTLTPNPAKPRGGVVVLDSWLIGEISATMREVAQRAPRGVILRSASERVFVAGADLAEIDALDDAALDAYLRAGSEAFSWFNKVPCPTVALVHRTALGGGLELAMHCDAIVAVMPAAGEKPWMIGLPECGLAICPGWGGTPGDRPARPGHRGAGGPDRRARRLGGWRDGAGGRVDRRAPAQRVARHAPLHRTGFGACRASGTRARTCGGAPIRARHGGVRVHLHRG